MTLNLTIENANEGLLKAIENMVKTTNAKIITKAKKSGILKKVIKKLESGEYEAFANFKEYKRQ